MLVVDPGKDAGDPCTVCTLGVGDLAILYVPHDRAHVLLVEHRRGAAYRSAHHAAGEVVAVCHPVDHHGLQKVVDGEAVLLEVEVIK